MDNMNKKELLEIICEIFNCKECPALVLRQINDFVVGRGYSYLDIARALIYYIQVEHKTLDIKYGIGLVPFIMEDSNKYYEELIRTQKKQLDALEKTKTHKKTIIHCTLNNKNTIKKNQIDINSIT